MKLIGVLILCMALNACAEKTVMNPMKLMPENTESIVLGMGCFWGAEKRMSEIPGVVSVESGYANGDIEGSYNAVLALERARQWGKSQARNHAEVVKVTFDPARIQLAAVLAKFWESHNPTQGDQQGNDVGSNYRSAIYTITDQQLIVARQTKDIYQQALTAVNKGKITTEIEPLQSYFTAEEYHQKYLQKNPDGYCGLGGVGVKFPILPLAKLILTPEQLKIAFEEATECAFTGSHLDEKRNGTFVDPITGAALFRSDTKFNSGTGWPSFFDPVQGSVTQKEDFSYGMKRIEVKSATSGIHLGHVFDDGPAPTHRRYCINGNVLKFIPDNP